MAILYNNNGNNNFKCEYIRQGDITWRFKEVRNKSKNGNGSDLQTVINAVG